MGKLNTRSYQWTSPPAVAFTAFADVWPRANETEIGAVLCAIGAGKDFDMTFLSLIKLKKVPYTVICIVTNAFLLLKTGKAATYQVMTYCKCSFLNAIRVWPPIGPPSTELSATESTTIGNAPTLDAILATSRKCQRFFSISLAFTNAGFLEINR